LRDLAPQVLGVVVRRYRDFGAAEDAVQEALVAAALQWSKEGVPDNPRAWLISCRPREYRGRFRQRARFAPSRGRRRFPGGGGRPRCAR